MYIIQKFGRHIQQTKRLCINIMKSIVSACCARIVHHMLYIRNRKEHFTRRQLSKKPNQTKTYNINQYVF